MNDGEGKNLNNVRLFGCGTFQGKAVGKRKPIYQTSPSKRCSSLMTKGGENECGK